MNEKNAMLQYAKEEFKPDGNSETITENLVLQYAKEEFKRDFHFIIFYFYYCCNMPKRNLNIFKAKKTISHTHKLQYAKEEFKLYQLIYLCII